MDIRELPLCDLTINWVLDGDVHQARAFANQDRDFGWHIATLPDVIRWRLDQSGSVKDKEKINSGWCLTDTEEYVVCTPDGENEILVIHGGALFTKPNLIYHLGLSFWDRGLEIDLVDSYYLRAGINTGMTSLEMLPYHLFLELDRQGDLPNRYGVRIDEASMMDRPNGYHSIDSFRHYPLLAARCGGVELADAYLDALKANGATHFQFEHEFDRRGETSFGFIVQTLGIVNISPFFGFLGDFISLTKPHYLVVKEKTFEAHNGGYRDPPRRV